MGKRTSKIWKMSRNEFQTLVTKSNSIIEILRYFNLVAANGSYNIIKRRFKEDNINYSHIVLGLAHNKGKKFISKTAFPLQRENFMVQKFIHKDFFLNGFIEQKISL